MGKGFFSTAELVVQPLVPRCQNCGLHRKCQSPNMPVRGKGKARVLFVAEAPGAMEDDEGDQFVGNSGRELRKVLNGIGIDLDKDCWKTNALTCYPGRGNPTPTNDQIEWCRPNLLRTIEKFKPVTIILMGGSAVRSLIGEVWKEDVGGIGRWVGWQIPSQKHNAWICPTWHPSYLLRQKDPVLNLLFEQHLKTAFGLDGKPWQEVPVYWEKPSLEYDSEKVMEFVRDWACKGTGPVAFDYETNMLKPDDPEAEIVSCAIAVDWNGDGAITTLSFPWQGKAVKAMSKLLKSKVPKIGWNLKFEERWTKTILGHGVRNWLWDGMQAAHVLDNRSGITSLTFQSFVQLGQAPYDGEVKPFLRFTGEGRKNRIRRLALSKLLLYGGMDALLTYEIAMKQMKQMGVKHGTQNEGSRR